VIMKKFKQGRGKMYMCEKCMDFRPDYDETKGPDGVKKFTCPVCGQEWALANVHPGNYWEHRYSAEYMARRRELMERG